MKILSRKLLQFLYVGIKFNCVQSLISTVIKFYFDSNLIYHFCHYKISTILTVIPGLLVLFGITFMLLPFNKLPSSAIAVSTLSLSANSMYPKPFGWPLNLSHIIVTLLTPPQPLKWASTSSAVALYSTWPTWGEVYQIMFVFIYSRTYLEDRS